MMFLSYFLDLGCFEEVVIQNSELFRQYQYELYVFQK
jgi:hypothetical protein